MQNETQNENAIELGNIRKTLEEINAIISQDTGVDTEKLKDAMLHVKKALHEAPHLVDFLLPEDIGIMVAAIRRQQHEDFLAMDAKKGTSGTTRRRTRAPKITAADLQNANVDELFGGL